MSIRGRFAPSPTGEMHLGNAWTALWAWLQVRKSNGTMILRMEDLDPDRSKPQYITQLEQDLHWLGLDWDEGPDVGGPHKPYSQSLRRDLYRQVVQRLERQGLLYPCYCTRAEIHAAVSAPHPGASTSVYPGTCRDLTRAQREEKESLSRSPALRIRVPDETISWLDGCHGQVVFHLRETGDFIIQRSDGVHAYQLAVVIDDGLMKISQVLRGDDLLPSTALQLYLYQLLNLPAPQFAHVPLIYGADGNRLSKRHGDLSIASLRHQGVQAEEIIGFLAHQGGLMPTSAPIRAKDLIPRFSLEKLPVQPVIITSLPFNH